MKIIYIKILLTIFLMDASCYQDEGTLNLLFEEVKRRIDDKNTLQVFKNLPRDSALINHWDFPEIDEKFIEVLEDPSYREDLENYFKKNGVDPSSKEGTYIILGLFHNELNNKNISFKRLKYEVYKLYEWVENEKIKKKELFEKENLKIFQLNNKGWRLGDTIMLIFPVLIKDNGQNKSTIHLQYPATLDYSYADDTLEVVGTIISKQYENFPGSVPEIDSADLILKTKILKISDTSTVIYGIKKYKIEDTFDFFLGYYGRPVIIHKKM